MEKKIIALIGMSLAIYIAAIIVFKENFNTITYFIDVFFFCSYILYVILKKDFLVKINDVIYSYILFLVFALFSSLYGVDFGTSSLISLQMFVLLLNMIFIYNVLKNFNLYHSFLNGILLASLINYIFIIGVIDPPFDIIMPGGGNRVMGTTGNPNVLAIFMLISILSSLIYLKEKINKYFFYYQYINIFMAIYVILLTVSKKGIILGLGLILIYIFTILKDFKNVFRLFFITSIVIAFIIKFVDYEIIASVFENVGQRFSAFNSQLNSNTSGGSTAERKYMIETAFFIFQDSPLLGKGLGNFAYFNRYHTYAHNNYLELLSGVGLIGAMLFYSIYFFLVRSVYKIKEKELKILLLFFLLIFLVMDVAAVTYSSKYILYTLIFIAAFAEKNKKSEIHKSNL